jgi:antitoxin ParD1/3/4
MSITLTPEQENLIQSLIATGRFNNSAEVIQIAFRLLEAAQREEQAWIEETRSKIDEGFTALERGETLDGETFVNQSLENISQSSEL